MAASQNPRPSQPTAPPVPSFGPVDPFRARVFLALVEQAPLPLVATSLATGEVHYCNQAANDAFNGGRSAVGLTSLDFYENPEDRAVMLAELQRRGSLRGYHLRMRHSDGSRGDYLVWMSPARVEGQALLLGYLLNVTKQRLTESALSQRNRELEFILGNVGDGLLMIDAQGRLLPERSATVEEWFGVPTPGTTFGEYTANHDPGFSRWFDVGWEAVVDRIMPLEVCLAQLPTLLRHDGRFLRVSYTPIARSAGEFERLLIVLTDVTQSLQREHAESAQRELIGVFDRVANDRAGVAEFFRESEAIVGSLERAQHPAIVLRLVHTLKGNATAVGLKRLADVCDEVETYIQENTAAPTPEHVTQLVLQWNEAAQVLRMFLRTDRDFAEVANTDLDDLRRAIDAGADHAQLRGLLDSWRLEPAERRFRRLAAQAVALAQRLNKGQLSVLTESNQVRLNSSRWAGFWSAFAHALRNAVDHGIEPAAERLAANKSPHGMLKLSIRVEGEQVLLELEDDGRGIDWDAIGARARALGLPAQTRAELQEALFAEGVTTAAHVTEYSGRGVGLSVLRDATLALGGTIAITSEPGHLTRLSFTFPHSVLD